MNTTTTVSQSAPAVNPLLEEARGYALRGWRVFPLNSDCPPTCCDPNCKKPKSPRFKEWQRKATTDLEQIDKWWGQWPAANIGLMHERIIAIDCDNHAADINGPENFEALYRDNSKQFPPQTPTQLTPTDGVHFLFELTDKQTDLSAPYITPGVQVRPLRNHYIVGAPSSVHGTYYKWLRVKDGTIRSPLAMSAASVPDWIHSLAAKPAEPATPAVGSELSLSMEPDFKTRCSAEDPAIKGSRGITSYKMACAGRDFGLPLEVTYQHMRDEWLPRWPEPCTEAELYEQVQHAYQYARGAVGGKNPERLLTPEMADQAAEARAWGIPQEIKTELLPVPKLSPDMMPEPLQPWLTDIAHRMNVPLEFPAIAAIVMTGSLIGAACGIKPKCKDSWTVVPNLWGGVVAQPGKKKTSGIAAPLSPMERLEKIAQDQYCIAKAEHDIAQQKYDATKKALSEGMKVAAKSSFTAKKGESDGPTIDDLSQKLAELAPPAAPIWRRYKTNDATVPKLAELLAQNPRGILVFRDEIVGLLTAFDKPGNEPDRAFYLEAWNGTGSWVDDRIGRGTTVVPNTCISLLGGIQPAKLERYLYEATQAGGNDGLVQRLQMLVYPDSVAFEPVDESPDREAANRAYRIAETLARMDFVAHGATIMDGEKQPTFRFDEAAQAFFFQWWTELETVKLTAKEDPLLIEHLSKYRSLMPTLALIFHLIDLADAGSPENRLDALITEPTPAAGISLKAARMAAQWCQFLESHARRIYGLISNIADKAAARLAERIQNRDLESPFTARDVYRKGWSLLDTKERAQEACQDLVDAEWLSLVPVPASTVGGRPTTGYLINPAVFGKPGSSAIDWMRI
jgi:hypothetical protein